MWHQLPKGSPAWHRRRRRHRRRARPTFGSSSTKTTDIRPAARTHRVNNALARVQLLRTLVRSLADCGLRDGSVLPSGQLFSWHCLKAASYVSMVLAVESWSSTSGHANVRGLMELWPSKPSPASQLASKQKSPRKWWPSSYRRSMHASFATMCLTFFYRALYKLFLSSILWRKILTQLQYFCEP